MSRGNIPIFICCSVAPPIRNSIVSGQQAANLLSLPLSAWVSLICSVLYIPPPVPYPISISPYIPLSLPIFSYSYVRSQFLCISSLSWPLLSASSFFDVVTSSRLSASSQFADRDALILEIQQLFRFESIRPGLIITSTISSLHCIAFPFLPFILIQQQSAISLCLCALSHHRSCPSSLSVYFVLLLCALFISTPSLSFLIHHPDQIYL